MKVLFRYVIPVLGLSIAGCFLVLAWFDNRFTDLEVRYAEQLHARDHADLAKREELRQKILAENEARTKTAQKLDALEMERSNQETTIRELKRQLVESTEKAEHFQEAIEELTVLERLGLQTTPPGGQSLNRERATSPCATTAFSTRETIRFQPFRSTLTPHRSRTFADCLLKAGPFHRMPFASKKW